MKFRYLAALLVPFPALAWQTPPPGPSTVPAVVSPSAAASSGSRSRVSNNVTVTTSSASSAASQSRNGGNPGQRAVNAPDVLAGAIAASNPCGVGASVGGSGTGAGGFIQLLTESGRCALREDARLLYNMGDVVAAKQAACHNPWIADAFAQARQPCEADKQRWWAAGYHERPDGYWER